MARSYWTNSDGLVVQFGPNDGENHNMARQASTAGVEQQLVLELTLASLSDTAVPANLNQAAKIPANSLIVSSLALTNAAAVGVNAVLHVGTYDSAGAVVDADGLNSHATAALTADTDVAGAGALIGTVVTADTWVAATYETAAFTAGTVKIIVTYIKQ